MEIVSNFFAYAVASAALAVVLIQQFMKLKAIPVSFANKHPVPTLIVLSIGASIAVTFFSPVHPVTWLDWVLLVASIALTAAITYNMTIKNWAELRAIEGPAE